MGFSGVVVETIITLTSPIVDGKVSDMSAKYRQSGRSMGTFGDRLKVWRVNAGFTSQQSLADEMGVSRSIVGGWETSDTPAHPQCVSLAEVLQLPLDEVWGVAAPERADPNVRAYYEGLLAAQEGLTESQRSLITALNNLSRKYPRDDFALYLYKLIIGHFDAKSTNVGKPLDALASVLRQLNKLPPRARRHVLQGFGEMLKGFVFTSVSSSWKPTLTDVVD